MLELPTIEDKPKKEFTPRVLTIVPGECQFVVIDYIDRDKNNPKQPLISSKGDPMVRFEIEVRDKKGHKAKSYQYFVPKTAFRLKQLCGALGMPQLYDMSKSNPKGLYDRICGCTGKCVIDIVHHEKYGDQVEIKKYIEADEHTKIVMTTMQQGYSVPVGVDFDADSIPF